MFVTKALKCMVESNRIIPFYANNQIKMKRNRAEGNLTIQAIWSRCKSSEVEKTRKEATEQARIGLELFEQGKSPVEAYEALLKSTEGQVLPPKKLAEVCFSLGTLHEALPDLFDQENLGPEIPLPDPEAAQSVLQEIRELRKEARREQRRVRKQSQEGGVSVTQVDGWREGSYGQGELQVENELAWDWYLQAAEKGHVEAMVALGRLCLPEAGDSTENARQVLRWYTEAATSLPLSLKNTTDLKDTSVQKMQADALYGLGVVHEQGLCGIQDHRTAAEFYRIACHMNSPSALYYTGHNYLTGNSALEIQKDPKLALDILEKAAEQGHGGAQTYVAMLYRSGYEEGHVAQDTKKFWKYLGMAETNGDDEALYLLGDIFFRGSDGAKKDHQKAFRFYERAASTGHKEACYCLGVMYYNGFGTDQSYEDSFRYYQYAAEQNHMLAWRNIASMHMLGHGVPKSESTAKHILKVLGDSIISQMENTEEPDEPSK